jgi:hypothetical protein
MANVNLVDVVAGRIKTSPLGDLIKEEDLYDIVKSGIERAFFSDRARPGRGPYSSETIPPLIIEIIRDSMRDAMRPHVDRWVAENADVFTATIKKVVDDGIVGAAEKIRAERTKLAMGPALQLMVQVINDDRTRQGLPTLPVYF